MKTISIIGSHGIYAKYGGYDNLVNSLVENANKDIKYIVFNSVETPVLKSKIPKNCKVIRLPLSASGYQGIVYDFLSMFIAIFMSKKFILLGSQGAPLIILLKLLTFGKLNTVINIGGIEWMRPHLSFFVKLYFKICFYISCYFSNTIVLDNAYFLDFVPKNKYIRNKISIIPYGGFIDKSITNIDEKMVYKYPFLNSQYFLSISRSNEDNLLSEICTYFKDRKDIKLVLISNLSNSDYGKKVKKEFENDPNIYLIDGLYIKPELDLIRRNCKGYIHTHTLCGSAPSLIEMIVAQRPIFSINVPQNQYTLDGNGFLFKDFLELDSVLYKKNIDKYIPPLNYANKFKWSYIVNDYENCFR